MGGNQFIDIILFAAVALFLVYRLWLVLGRRTGAERPPQLPPALGRMAQPGNVMPLPAAPVAAPAAPPRDPLQAGLADIMRADSGFRPDRFLGGARQAFEMIVKAFAEGDTAKLRPLLSDEVYDTFTEVIRHRLAVKESAEASILGLQDPEIVEARFDGRNAFVTVKFASRQIVATRDADGKLVEGDAEHPVERTDFWTFSRNTRSSDPNWQLVATGAPE